MRKIKYVNLIKPNHTCDTTDEATQGWQSLSAHSCITQEILHKTDKDVFHSIDHI